MNSSRIVLACTGILLVAVILFPPFYVFSPDRGAINLGFAWILDPPANGRAPINTTQLSIQLLVVLAVGGMAWLFVKEK